VLPVLASCNGILGLEEGNVIGTGGMGQGGSGTTTTTSTGGGACIAGDGTGCTVLPDDCSVAQPAGNMVRNASFEPPGDADLDDWTVTDVLEPEPDYSCNADRSLNFLSTPGTASQSLVLPADLGEKIPACSCITASIWRVDYDGDAGHQLRIRDAATSYELFRPDPLGGSGEWVHTVEHCWIATELQSPTLELHLRTAADYVDMVYVKVDPAACCTKPCLALDP
jgi:hypothetical protein